MDTQPIPRVTKVAPRCRICRETVDLIEGDGPAVCRLCLRIQTRVAGIADARPHDDNAREGWR